MSTQHQYGPQGRLVDVTHSIGATPLQSFAYTHDPVGNILSITEPAQTRNFTYDDLQRLTAGGTAAAPESYSYDGIGNRTASHLSASHVTDSANRLTEDDSFCYAYDANGNLTTKTAKVAGVCTGGVTAYTWDAENRLIQIDFPDLTTASYRYDGFGRRIEKNVAGIITRYVYDNQDLLLEYDGTNTLLARYSYGDRLDQPLAVERAGQSFFYQANHQGTVTQITDGAGFVVNSYEYDSYGNIESAVEGIPNPFTYTAREFDAESGLYFYRARYYDAETGRFLKEDPIGFAGGFNLYRYVRNNPVKNRDPLGLEVTMVCRAAGSSWSPAKHCFVVVWHWESDPCTGERFRVIDRQYTVGGGQTTPYPQDSPESTFTDDTEAFNDPSPEDFYNIPVPDGMSQQEFDDSVTQTGEDYNAAYSYTGSNSNTAADNIIEDAGGTVPDVSGAYNQNWGEPGGGR